MKKMQLSGDCVQIALSTLMVITQRNECEIRKERFHFNHKLSHTRTRTVDLALYNLKKQEKQDFAD